MRKSLLAVAVLALLLGLYAGAGYLLAPRLAHDFLTERARDSGLELRLDKVRTDPFALRLQLEGVEVLARDGARLAYAEGMAADLAWASLWRRAWIVQRAWVQRPTVEIALGAQGDLNWPLPSTRDAGDPPPAIQVGNFSIDEGAVHFVDRSRGAAVEVNLEAVGFQLAGLSTRSGERGEYQLAARLVQGGTLASSGSVSLAPLAASGKLSIAGVALEKLWQLAAPGSQSASGALQASASYEYDGRQVLLHDVSADAKAFAYSGVELHHVAVRSPEVALPSASPFEIAITAAAEPRGDLAANGSIGLRPFSADLQLELADIELQRVQRWLPEHWRMNIAAGLVSASGQLKFPEAIYEGAAAVSKARFEEAGSGQLLLGWERLETEQLSLRFAPYGVEIDELTAHAPSGRLIIEADGRVNLAEVFKHPAPGHPAPSEDGTGFRAAVRHLSVEKGVLEFADRSLDNDFSVTIRELSGAINGFSTVPGNPARVQLTGRVERYGSARIRGTVNLDAPKSLTTINARFRNLNLAELTPYTAKFAGYRMESGRLQADLRYRVREGRLVGDNKLVIEDLQLGEKVDSPSALDLPLELAIALLKDPSGRIDLAIPVRGDLSDPQFDLGGLIAQAIGNVIGRILSAPFRALAALFGGAAAEDLDRIAFAPGSAELTPPQEENIARVAQALAQRPALGVKVQGGYDAERDQAALRMQAARRDIARQAGSGRSGPLDFSDPKVLQAAEKLYLARIGNRRELLKLRESEPRYGRALVERLAAATTLEPSSATALARMRSEAVRTAVLDHGIDPSRVVLEAPGSAKAAKEGVPTVLSLSADLPMQQQAQREAPQEDGGILRRVQGKLNKAGFAAGPLDGSWGPMTQRALQRYQESRGLPVTGELDVRTLLALGVIGDAATGATGRKQP